MLKHTVSAGGRVMPADRRIVIKNPPTRAREFIPRRFAPWTN
jgi:hypothetical protein